MTSKTLKPYSSIKEVSKDLELPSHVLRFWETKFKAIKPVKRGGGCRYYRPEDIDLIKHIKHLLYEEKYTIKGALAILKEEKEAAKSNKTGATLSDSAIAAPAAPAASSAPVPKITVMQPSYEALITDLQQIRTDLERALS